MSDANAFSPPFHYQELPLAFIIRSSSGLPSKLHNYNDKTLSNNKVIGQKVHDQNPGVSHINRFHGPGVSHIRPSLKTGVGRTRFSLPVQL